MPARFGRPRNPPMARDWRTSYFEQARSDFDVFQQLRTLEDVSPCHFLHYLQMATEKLAKGFRTVPGGQRHELTHSAFETFLRIAKRRPEIRRACRFTKTDQFAAYIDGLLPLAARIERLAPALSNGPDPEYPWEQKGVIYVPASYPFVEFDMRSPKMIKMLKFLDSCFSIIT